MSPFFAIQIPKVFCKSTVHIKKCFLANLIHFLTYIVDCKKKLMLSGNPSHWLAVFQWKTMLVNIELGESRPWKPYTEHLTSWILFCLVFKWSDQVIRRTIQILDILDHKTYIFCPVFRPPFEIQTSCKHDMFGPFEYQTCPVIRWLLYSTKCWINWCIEFLDNFEKLNRFWKNKC